MSVLTHHADAASDVETGELTNLGVTLTRGAYWTDEGNHIFSSTEFDVMAEGDTRDTAFDAFVENLLEHCSQLAELLTTGQATAHEQQEFGILSERFLEVMRRHDSEHEPAIALNFLRRRQHPRRSWRSLHENSSAVLNA